MMYANRKSVRKAYTAVSGPKVGGHHTLHLDGFTVLDLTEGVAGPCACQMLGDMGAEVLKIERPQGDWGRQMGVGHPEGGPSFRALNRNKRNICIDLRQPRGTEVIWRLIGRADAMVTSYRPGAMEKLGLGYESVHLQAPQLIYARISAFGYKGVLAERPGSDTILQAVSGLMSQIGEPEGEPQRVGVPVIDVIAARDTVIGLLADLLAVRAGKGVEGPIDVSLYASAAALQYLVWQRYFDDGTVQRREGQRNAGIVPGGLYKTRDGRHIAVVVLREEHWLKFCHALGISELIEDERFLSNTARLEHRDELDAILVRRFLAKNFDEWARILLEHDVLAGPVTDVTDILADKALASALPLQEIPRGNFARDTRSIGLPIAFRTPDLSPDQVRPPAAKGEHTRELLAEVGYTPDEIQELVRSGTTPSQET